jgi:hypothetical protein
MASTFRTIISVYSIMPAPARGCPPGSEWDEFQNGCYQIQERDPMGASRNLLANVKDPRGHQEIY